MSFYCNIKDKVPNDQRSHVIYVMLFVKCPGCNDCYRGKTERCFTTRITELGTKEAEHLNISLNMKPLKIVVRCILFCYYSMKMNMTISMTSNIFDVNAVLQNHEMLHTNRN